jgi:hypothetical protein
MISARSLTAVALITGTWAIARPPMVADADVTAAVARFRFTEIPLNEPSGGKTVRVVHPSLDRISAWISSVGAGAALADFDGDGLANDVCIVDPRFDGVEIRPVPGHTGPVHRLFPSPEHWDGAKMAPMGCVAADLDEDGHTDALVYYWGRTPLLFLQRSGEFVEDQLTGQDEAWFSNAATVADLDGDGHLDIVIGNYFPDGAAILDVTDPRPQLMQDSMSAAFNGGSKRFLRFTGVSGGVPRFEDVQSVLSAPEATGWTLAVGAQDLDGDQLPELYLANDFGPDVLLRNRSTPGMVRFEPVSGHATVTSPGSKVIGRDSFKGMGVDFGDINADGLTDIWVSNIAAPYALLESHFAWLQTQGTDWTAGPPVRDDSEDWGLSRSDRSWDAKLADFDNDGQVEALQATGFVAGGTNRWAELQELATGNDILLHLPEAWPRFQPGDGLSAHAHVPFFVRIGDRFTDLASAVGLGSEQVSRGLAIADTDGDGDLDLVVANQWRQSMYYRNDQRGKNSSLFLRLLLAPGARGATVTEGLADSVGSPAVGAEAVVGQSGRPEMRAQVDGGNGHSGRRAPELQFGLGAESTAVSVALSWRDRAGQPQNATLTLPPGRHTLVLGTNGGAE